MIELELTPLTDFSVSLSLSSRFPYLVIFSNSSEIVFYNPITEDLWEDSKKLLHDKYNIETYKLKL